MENKRHYTVILKYPDWYDDDKYHIAVVGATTPASAVHIARTGVFDKLPLAERFGRSHFDFAHLYTFDGAHIPALSWIDDI